MAHTNPSSTIAHDEESLFVTPGPESGRIGPLPPSLDAIPSPSIKQEEIEATGTTTNAEIQALREQLADCHEHGQELEEEIRGLKQQAAKVMSDNAGLKEENEMLKDEAEKSKTEVRQRGEEILRQRRKVRVLQAGLDAAEAEIRRRDDADIRRGDSDWNDGAMEGIEREKGSEAGEGDEAEEEDEV